jgi:L-malate glycosyltransferase
MRVLFLPRWYPTSDHPYEGAFVREHARAAAAAGVEVAVVHIPGIYNPRRRLWQVQEEDDSALDAGIPTYHVLSRTIRVPGSARLSFWLSYGLYMWSAIQGYRRARSRGFRPDLVHAHVFSAAPVGLVVGRIFRLPLVVTEHSTSFPLRKITGGTLRRSRYAMQKADRVLPVSKFLEQAIEESGIHARFQVVPNGVDATLFHPREEGAPRGNGSGDGRKGMIFVGNLSPDERKGFPTLIEALKTLRERRTDWHLDVCGAGAAHAESVALVEREGLESMVTFHGTVPKAKVAELMRGSDLFVLPSRCETQGCVIIEAMASGLPIVSTPVGGITELVSPADGLLVPPDDAPALADALDSVLSNPASYNGREIAARAVARYSLEAVGAQLAGVYAAVLAAHARTRGSATQPIE